MRLLFVVIHLIGAIASVFVTAILATVPVRWKWPVMAIATVCAMLNAGAVVALLV